jgi:hypothetical protein
VEDGGDGVGVAERSRSDESRQQVSMSCWFASARRNSAVRAPNAGELIASPASSCR